METRTNKSIRNIKFAVVGQAFALIISFISRMVFVRVLNAEYLGVDGLFTNILSILSLADLGLGTAVIYSLYKPLAENDEDKILLLMKLYRKAFIGIGLIVLVSGIIMSPFLSFFIKETPDIAHLHFIFLMFVVNTSISYFYAYKRSIIIASQNRHITSLYRYSFFFGLNVLQIVVLLLTHNYILFLSLLLVNTFFENFFVARKANNMFPFLRKKIKGKLAPEERREIVKNVKAMSFHKIGGVVVNGTDNILLSKIVGVVAVGLYSNYLVIINALTLVFSLAFQAVTASIGNLVASEGKEERSVEVFNILNFIGFLLYGTSFIILFNTFNPLINLWLGEEYVFEKQLVNIVVINFFITGMRKSVLTFRDAMGLYWHDRYKSLFEAGINIIASIVLGLKFGIIGIFFGTFISTVTTCFWVEPYILYKYGFKRSVKAYFISYLKYGIALVLVWRIVTFVCQLLPEGILFLILKLILSGVLSVALFTLIFFKTSELSFLKDLIKNQFLNRLNR